MRRYTIILTPDLEAGGYTVEVPAIRGCRTQGEKLEEAISNAREAIEACLEALAAPGRPIPEERQHPQAIVIDVGDVAASRPAGQLAQLCRQWAGEPGKPGRPADPSPGIGWA